jgi:hypothetical protein
MGRDTTHASPSGHGDFGISGRLAKQGVRNTLPREASDESHHASTFLGGIGSENVTRPKQIFSGCDMQTKYVTIFRLKRPNTSGVLMSITLPIAWH